MPKVLGFLAHIFLYVDLTARGPLSSIWQILAVLAVAGIVLVLVLAIIEPGPLVKRRPFSRKERSRRSESDGAPWPQWIRTRCRLVSTGIWIRRKAR